MECPAESVLIDLVAHVVAAEPASELEAHLADCAECRRLVFALASERGASSPGEPRHRIGRFEVIAEIGAGAMGRVYRARDPLLKREVAIKMRVARSALTSDGDERLFREGQALARLSHPNVVAVYETGVDDGASYIVMEYVEGVTLDRWVATPRPLRAVIDVLAGSARGLAAAHAVGLVHRDVKPRNILVTPDGTAKVGDFGLARLEIDRAAQRAIAQPASELMITLSATGSLIGTPAYMAPEQLRGGVATEASDQFGFCVTLFEAVTGSPPFTGRTTVELVAAIEQGPSSAVLDRLPARLRAVLARGLQSDPARRFPSMTALGEALAPRAARRRWFALAGATGLVVAGALLARPADPADRCGAPDARLPAMFGAAHRARIAVRSAAGDAGDGREARQAGDLLAAYGERWQSAEASSCRASGGQPSPLRDRERACLERRLARADDLAALLAQPAADAQLGHAVRAVEALADPVTCLRSAASSTDRDPPGAGLAPLIAAYERQIDRLANLVEARRTAQARDIEGLVAAVAALDVPALHARALVAQAQIYAERERGGGLDDLLAKAIREAARAHDDLALAEAWTARAFIVYARLNRPSEARGWVAAADAAIVRAGEPPELRSRLHQVAGALYAEAGEYARARREMSAALALLERKQPPAELSVAAVHNNLGTVLIRAGAMADARVELERSLAVVRRVHGDLHIDVICSLMNLGNLLGAIDPRAAIAPLAEARQLASRLGGPSSVNVAKSLDLEGIARYSLGEYAAAAALHRQAYELKRAGGDAMRSSTAYSLQGLSMAEGALRDYPAAVRDARAALQIFTATRGPNDTSLAIVHAILGEALIGIRDVAGAIAEYRASLAIYDQAEDHGRWNAAIVRVELAQVLVATGDTAAARVEFSRAEPVLRVAPDRNGNRESALLARAGLMACDAADRRVDRARLRALEDAVAAEPTLSPEVIGFTAFARARAWAVLGDRGQARALAAVARAAYVKARIADRGDVPARALAAIR